MSYLSKLFKAVRVLPMLRLFLLFHRKQNWRASGVSACVVSHLIGSSGGHGRSTIAVDEIVVPETAVVMLVPPV